MSTIASYTYSPLRIDSRFLKSVARILRIAGRERADVKTDAQTVLHDRYQSDSPLTAWAHEITHFMLIDLLTARFVHR